MKPAGPSWPPDWLPATDLHVPVTQWALGCYEHFVSGAGEAWLAAAIAAGEHLLVEQAVGGRQDGGFVHTRPFPHTFRVDPPWLSGITQGQAASLFVRLHRETGDGRFGEAAVRALRPLDVASADGGVQALLDGRPLPEEYPTNPPSFVLNGGLFALFGVYDVATGLRLSETAHAFDELAETFAVNLHRWDLGYWSRYDLYPHKMANVASSSYHHLHTSQLAMLSLLSPRPEFPAFRDRFASYQESRSCRRRAFTNKVVFRLRVSRRREV